MSYVVGPCNIYPYTLYNFSNSNEFSKIQRDQDSIHPMRSWRFHSKEIVRTLSHMPFHDTIHQWWFLNSRLFPILSQYVKWKSAWALNESSQWEKKPIVFSTPSPLQVVNELTKSERKIMEIRGLYFSLMLECIGSLMEDLIPSGRSFGRLN